MTIVVNSASRTAEIASPAVFAAMEAIQVVMTGAAAALASLKLLLLLTDGTSLGLCSSFAESPSGTFTGTLDLRTDPVQTAFENKRPDERLPAIIAIGDASRLWVCQGVEIVNNPLAGEPVAPDPATVYLTTAMFDDLADLADDPTGDEKTTKIKAIIAILKGT